MKLNLRLKTLRLSHAVMSAGNEFHAERYSSILKRSLSNCRAKSCTPGKKCLEIARGKCPDFLPEVANNFGGLVMNLQGEILGILSVAPFNCCSSWVTGV